MYFFTTLSFIIKQIQGSFISIDFYDRYNLEYCLNASNYYSYFKKDFDIYKKSFNKLLKSQNTKLFTDLMVENNMVDSNALECDFYKTTINKFFLKIFSKKNFGCLNNRKFVELSNLQIFINLLIKNSQGLNTYFENLIYMINENLKNLNILFEIEDFSTTKDLFLINKLGKSIYYNPYETKSMFKQESRKVVTDLHEILFEIRINPEMIQILRINSFLMAYAKYWNLIMYYGSINLEKVHFVNLKNILKNYLICFYAIINESTELNTII